MPTTNVKLMHFVLQTCESATSDLDKKLFDAYLEHRVEPLSGALEPGMYAGDFDWNECLKPSGKRLPIYKVKFCLSYLWMNFLCITDVRPYIKTALMSIIAIHSEVCCQNFLGITMPDSKI